MTSKRPLNYRIRVAMYEVARANADLQQARRVNSHIAVIEHLALITEYALEDLEELQAEKDLVG